MGEDKYRILIIDDTALSIVVLDRILSTDYTVLTAKTGTEGLERVEEDKPDLILLDVVMPDMSGFDVLKKLKSNPETMQIPVIIITGLDSDTDEEKGLLLGAVDYIIKPFKNAIVKARVKTHIQIVHQFKMIERLSLVDPLTDIANRRCFDEHLSNEWRRAMRLQKPLSFLMMDLDNFKDYNDTYGHPQGDTLLKTVAKIFIAVARRPGDLAARIGGEEFGLLLPETYLENALDIAEEIRSTLEATGIPTADGKTITYATISIGVASCIPMRDSNIDDFIAQADTCLYAAKSQGRNQVVS